MKIHGQTSLDVEISMLYFLMVHQAAEESLLRFERPRTMKKYVDDGGRFIVLNTLTEDSPVVLINYYAPDEEKDQLKVLDDLNYILDNTDISEDTVLVWGGDFNLIFDIGLDADGGTPKLKLKCICKVSSIMSENDLCDIYRMRNPETKRFTWRRKTPLNREDSTIF